MINDALFFYQFQKCHSRICELSALPGRELLKRDRQELLVELASKALAVAVKIQPHNMRQLAERICEYRSLLSEVKLISDKIHKSKSLGLRLINRLGLGKSPDEKQLQKQYRGLKSQYKELVCEYRELTAPAFLQSQKEVERIRLTQEQQQVIYRLMPLSDEEEKAMGIAYGDYRFNALSCFRGDIEAYEELVTTDPSNPNLLSSKELRQLAEMKQSLSEAAAYAEEIELAQYLVENRKGVGADLQIQYLLRKLRDRICNLREGESMLIPGGTNNHSVIYKLMRTSADGYSFELFNTGEGALVYSDDKSREVELVESFGVAFPFRWSEAIALKWEGCSLSSLVGSSFLSDLVKVVMPRSRVAMYEVLEMLLKSSIGHPVCSARHLLQPGNSCTYHSILVCAKDSLSFPVYDSLHLLLIRRAGARVNAFFQESSLRHIARKTLVLEEQKIHSKLGRYEWLEQKTAQSIQLAHLFQRVMELRFAPISD